MGNTDQSEIAVAWTHLNLFKSVMWYGPIFIPELKFLEPFISARLFLFYFIDFLTNYWHC